jgi:hypothetical protein
MSVHGTFAKPTVDVAFRHMMSDPDIALSLINSLLPDLEVTEISRGPEDLPISPKRDAFMDFHARTKGNGSVIIEMQAKRHVMFDERSLLYAAYAYCHQFSDEVLGEGSWFEQIRPVYAVQLIDYDTNIVRGQGSSTKNYGLDQVFVDEVRSHPMKKDVFMKHYVMADVMNEWGSGQKITRGIHMIQIELPRVGAIRSLSPDEEGFMERSQKFTAQDWWYCVLKYANGFDVDELGASFDDRRGQFRHIHECVYNAFKKLRREKWGIDFDKVYEHEALDVDSYSTMIIANREDARDKGREEGKIMGREEGKIMGREEGEAIGKIMGQIEGLINVFMLPVGENLLPALLKTTEKHSIPAELIQAAWSGYAAKQEVPRNKTMKDFITLLGKAEVLKD